MGGLPIGKELLSDLLIGVGDGVKGGGAGAFLVGTCSNGDSDESLFLSLGVEGVGGAGLTGLLTIFLMSLVDFVTSMATFTAFLNS